MEVQEIFDTVLAHLRKQGKAAVDGDRCMYRAPDGSMCAVGCLIADDEYDPKIESYDVKHMASNGWLQERLSPHVDLMRRLQNSHDDWLRCGGVNAWERSMSIIAYDFGLKYEVPQ